MWSIGHNRVLHIPRWISGISRKHFKMFISTGIIILTVIILVVNYIVFKKRYSGYNPYILDTLPQHSEDIYDSLSSGNHISHLKTDTSFLTVHYLWCNDRTFEYRHFLSMMSILKMLHPDKIVFHYNTFPKFDNPSNWLQDLQRTIAILTFSQSPDLCDGNYNDISGIVVTSDTIITNLNRSLIISKLSCQRETINCFTEKIFPPRITVSIGSTKNTKTENVNCRILSEVDTSLPLPECIQLSINVQVEDILHGNDYFQKFCRRILFEKETVIMPESSSNLIPLLGHIISDIFTIRTYISIVSAVQRAGIKTIFYHGKEIPRNSLWDKVQKLEAAIHYIEIDSKHFPKCRCETVLYGAYTLLQYGGILFSEDIIWQTQISEKIRKFDAVGSILNEPPNRSKYVSLDIMMAKNGAKFIQGLVPLLQQLAKYGKDDTLELWTYHLYELQPYTLQVSSQLFTRVICNTIKCSRNETSKLNSIAILLKFTGTWNIDVYQQLNLTNIIDVSLNKYIHNT